MGRFISQDIDSCLELYLIRLCSVKASDDVSNDICNFEIMYIWLLE